MVRDDDGAVRVLYNRCAHKGTPLVTEKSGNTGRFFRCPYHAWTYRLDGALRAVPLAGRLRGHGPCASEAARGMRAPAGVAVHRDFVFAKINPGGPDFADYFGEALASIDNLVDRSPVGRLRIEGGVPAHPDPLQLEDLPREHQRHGASALDPRVGQRRRGRSCGKGRRRRAPKPMAIEQILPFGAGHDFFDRMGGRVLPNGHSVLGTQFSIHSGYGQVPEYEAAMRRRTATSAPPRSCSARRRTRSAIRAWR